jgi:hypothetical protein
MKKSSHKITKPPSRIKAKAKRCDSLPDYSILDKILYQYIGVTKKIRR